MPKKKQETEEPSVAIVPTEVGHLQLATVMEGEAQKRELITRYISSHMKRDTDYGTIKIGGRESKPSLFKPGSEKFLSLFRLTARFERDIETWEMAGSETGVFAYKCLLYATNGQIVGEGRGISKLTEKAGWTINNAVKIAEKRAQIDAVLRTGALSDFFTQDLEDMASPTPPEPVYDKTPVSARAKVIVSGTDTDDEPFPSKGSVHDAEAEYERQAQVAFENMTAPRDVLAKKARIKELIDKRVLTPLAQTAESYEKYVVENFDLELEEDNFDKIIEALENPWRKKK